MSERPHPHYTRRVAVWSVILAAGCVGGLILAGCDRGETSSTGGAERARSGRAEGRLPVPRCEELLKRALDMMQPDRLGPTADPEAVVQTLNRWLTGCAEPPETWPKLAPQAEAILTPELQEEIQAQRFTARDAMHVRNALLLRRTNEFAAVGDDELARVVALFYYVTDNVALIADPSSDIPRSPFESLLLGRGTAEDRAWLFVELLRQLQIDGVVLEADGDWLVGVVLGGDVFLFDPRLGLPIPAPAGSGESPRPLNPATLAQAAESDEILRALDAEEDPYPWTAQELQAPQVALVGTASLWAPRMRELQANLTGEQSVVVFEPLLDADGNRGMLDRVAEAGQGRWDRDDVRVWPYPESQVRALEAQGAAGSEAWQAAMRPFEAPVPILRIARPRLSLTFGAPEREQLNARVRQLLGDFVAAVLSYVNMRRIGSDLPPLSRSAPEDARILESERASVRELIPANVQALHDRAAQDAYFWTGLAKRMTGNLAGAADTFQGYLESYPEGPWAPHARALLAIVLAEQGRFGDAVERLEAFPPDHPQAAGLRVLQRRWQEESGAP